MSETSTPAEWRFVRDQVIAAFAHAKELTGEDFESLTDCVDRALPDAIGVYTLIRRDFPDAVPRERHHTIACIMVEHAVARGARIVSVFDAFRIAETIVDNYLDRMN